MLGGTKIRRKSLRSSCRPNIPQYFGGRRDGLLAEHNDYRAPFSTLKIEELTTESALEIKEPEQTYDPRKKGMAILAKCLYS